MTKAELTSNLKDLVHGPFLLESNKAANSDICGKAVPSAAKRNADDIYSARLTEPGNRLPEATTSYSAVLLDSNSVLELITHQAFAQEPWIRNTL